MRGFEINENGEKAAAQSAKPRHLGKLRAKALAKPSAIRPQACLGFRYSEAQELAIMRAKHQAAEYMKTYGRGRKPFDIDLTHYYNDEII